MCVCRSARARGCVCVCVRVGMCVYMYHTVYICTASVRGVGEQMKDGRISSSTRSFAGRVPTVGAGETQHEGCDLDRVHVRVLSGSDHAGAFDVARGCCRAAPPIMLCRHNIL